MLLIRCPYCGERPEMEFRAGGQAHLVRPTDPASVNDDDWAAFLFYRDNIKGMQAERWNHAHGCGRWFNALRDSTSDKFKETYRTGEPREASRGDKA